MINTIAASTQTNPQSRAFGILTQIASARSQVYRWLALGFYPPDEKLVNAFDSGQAIEEIAGATTWLGQDQKRLQNSLAELRALSISLENLSPEYTRLFCKSVERISMRESTYRWREASTLRESASDVARALRQEYGQFGVVPVRDREDTLAVELEFMAFLCERESGEWKRQAAEAARQLRRQERVFLDDHLARWYPEFCWRITASAKESFYGMLASLTDTWLNLEYGPGYIAVK